MATEVAGPVIRNNRRAASSTAFYVVTLVLLFTGWWLLSGHEAGPACWPGWSTSRTSSCTARRVGPCGLRRGGGDARGAGAFTFVRETLRIDRGDAAGWPAARGPHRALPPPRPFDPGQRIANIAFVATLGTLIGTGIGLTTVHGPDLRVAGPRPPPRHLRAGRAGRRPCAGRHRCPAGLPGGVADALGGRVPAATASGSGRRRQASTRPARRRTRATSRSSTRSRPPGAGACRRRPTAAATTMATGISQTAGLVPESSSLSSAAASSSARRWPGRGGGRGRGRRGRGGRDGACGAGHEAEHRAGVQGLFRAFGPVVDPAVDRAVVVGLDHLELQPAGLVRQRASVIGSMTSSGLGPPPRSHPSPGRHLPVHDRGGPARDGGEPATVRGSGRTARPWSSLRRAARPRRTASGRPRCPGRRPPAATRCERLLRPPKGPGPWRPRRPQRWLLMHVLRSLSGAPGAGAAEDLAALGKSRLRPGSSRVPTDRTRARADGVSGSSVPRIEIPAGEGPGDTQR